MEDIQFLTPAEVLALHKKQISEKGGAKGVLSMDKLESAVKQPKQTFGDEYLYSDLFSKAAAYLISIIRNHPFMDGNKRTGTHAAVTFL